MPANEFEMNMQRKMEELNLDPSTEVWREVERRIRKEKKRRGMFFWLILAGIMLGGTTIALVVINSTRKNEIATNQIKKQDNTNTIKENTISIDQPTETDLRSKDKNLETSLQDDNIVKTELPTSSLQEKNKKNENVPKLISSKKEMQSIPAEPEIVSSTKIPTGKPVQKTNNLTEPIQPTYPIMDTTTVVTKIKVPENEEKKITTQSVVQTEVSAIEPKNDQTAKKENKDKKKIDWGFWAQAGVSGNVNGFRLFNDRLYSSALSQSASPTGSVTLKRKLKPGISFSTGMDIRQPLSPRLTFNTGLGYTYLSTRILAGPLTDTMGSITNPASSDLVRARFYPASGNLSGISNRYHFLDLSAELSWRIINKKNFSLYWDNGISYKLLFASRVLHYDHGLKGYYEDPRLVNKHFAFISTGFSIPVSKSITLRPFAEFSLTRVFKDHDTSSVHFTNYGLRLKFSLGGKK